jgi:MSHA biogenesis protein MshG
MPAYAYRARNPRGEMLSGLLEGASSNAVAEELIRSGLTPIEVKARTQQAEGERASLLDWLTTPKVGLLDLMLFTRQMASLLRAGVPILRALATLEESSTHKTFKAILGDIREGLSAGRELSACLRKHPRVFEGFVISMVRVGETTGRLDEVFLRLFQHFEFEREMREQAKSALRYPSFVIAALVVAVGIINVVVIPAFAKVYANAHADLPVVTLVLITVSNFSVQWWPFILVGAILAIGLFMRWTRSERGSYLWQRTLLRIPIVGKIVHKVALARFARGLSMTYQSGVPIVQGLTATAQIVGNVFIAERIEQMCTAVERGEALTRAAITTGVFTPVVLQMMAVGEETGELDRLLAEIAEMYQREVEYEVGSLSEQLEPILLAGLGGIVLVVALGVFLPMWDLGATLLHKK